ncbi:MAG: NADH-quinone oxidoreductase subunit A [Chloroflexota bacterium]|nr:NADH-quinone oxidoreductase subunit A [Chloroflexota bacterium]MDE2970308.1 NADH-quinone oxidoreductase subunit A [Chloroflexota bacterium]
MPEGYALNYTAVVIVAAVGLLAMGGMLAASFFLAPKRKSADKDLPFECGIPPTPFTWSQIHVRYYIFAILFLLFDVEAVFIFPWILTFLQSAAQGASWVFYEMILFIAILLFGVLYGWRKGVLQWR